MNQRLKTFLDQHTGMELSMMLAGVFAAGVVACLVWLNASPGNISAIVMLVTFQVMILVTLLAQLFPQVRLYTRPAVGRMLARSRRSATA